MFVHAIWATERPHAVLQKAETLSATIFLPHSFYFRGFFISHFFRMFSVILAVGFQVLEMMKRTFSQRGQGRLMAVGT